MCLATYQHWNACVLRWEFKTAVRYLICGKWYWLATDTQEGERSDPASQAEVWASTCSSLSCLLASWESQRFLLESQVSAPAYLPVLFPGSFHPCSEHLGWQKVEDESFFLIWALLSRGKEEHCGLGTVPGFGSPVQMLCCLQNGAVAAHRAGGCACLQTAKHSTAGEGKTVDQQLQSCPYPAVAKWNWHLGLRWETRGRELIKDQFLIFCFGGNAEQQQKCWSCWSTDCCGLA